MITLRDYQQAAVDSVLEYWSEGGGSALVEMPTGSGKSATMAELFRRLSVEYEGTRIALLTHVQELVEQDAAAMIRVWPEAPMGIYSAGLNKRDGNAPIVFAGIQSVFRSPDCLGPRHVLCIDEAHLLSRTDDGMYQKAIAHYKTLTPGLRVVGFTATSFRTDSGLLTDGWRNKPALFDDLVFKQDVLPLIERGFLSPLIPYAPKTRLSVEGVRKQGGEYVQKELQQAVDIDETNTSAVDELVLAGEHRRSWIIFASGVTHAEHIRDLLRLRGISAEMVLGDTPKPERASIIARFKSGDIRAVVGNNVLTTGFDAPQIDFIAILRPTASKGLHLQMLGRGLRIADGKSECIVADFAGNCIRHGPIDMMDGSKAAGGEGAAPMKECPSCNAIVHASATKCLCGHEFPRIPSSALISTKPLGGAIFSNQMQAPQDTWYDVVGISCRRHTKPGSPDSLRIEYRCGKLGMKIVSIWLALESQKASGMARGWWKNNTANAGDAPTTVAEGISRIDELRIPGRILVGKDGQYERIIKCDYSVPPEVPVVIERTMSWRAA